MFKPTTLKDFYREKRIFGWRSLVALACVALLIILLIVRMVSLQVFGYEKYSTLADKNRISVEPLAPNRGLILDRNGTLLADNQPSYSVSITKEFTQDITATIAELRALIAISDSDVDRFQKRLQRRRRPRTPVALKLKLSETEISIIAVNQHRLPGVSLQANLVRNYPHRNALSHAIGYVGRINERELQRVDLSRYSATEHIGKTGIEAFYEDQLHGQVGYQTIETDARGRVNRILEQQDPIPGSDLHLYLDLDTQLAAIDALDGRRGAVVAIEPATGGILALVSTPGFDPNLFVTGIDYATYNGLRDSRARPLFNRAIQGQYPPGSTVKPFIGLAGLEGGFTTWQHSIRDRGFFKLDNDERLYRDWKKEGHGITNLHKAVVESCDTYFYQLANKMGVDAIHDFLVPFGFGNKTHIDLISERRGILPSSDWKRQTKRQPWYPGETLIVGIGQGYFLTTPLQLALATAILANQGKPVQPRMVAAIDKLPLPPAELSDEIQLQPTANWELMIKSMEDVVHTPKGTAWRIGHDLKQYKIAGKTGTSQVLGIAQDEEYDPEKIAEWHRDHALFVGFAPIEQPQIALAVLVENGGSGGSTAAPVARQVFDRYLQSVATSQSVSGR